MNYPISNKMKKIVFSVVFLFIASVLNAQDTMISNPLTISAYAEVYYSYDMGNPENHERPPFLYNYNRHNEVNLNLGFLKAAYNNEKIRANLALMSGTYSQYNLSSEHPIFQHLLEANIGVKISNTKNLWIDVGVMSSHLGFETAIGKDCWNLTRSILAENSPYYESGIKLGYTSKNEKLYVAAMYLNGWQHIQRISGNNTPAFGTQLTYKTNSKFSFNWSTFIGNEKPDSVMQWRYFNNFYGQFQLNNKLAMILGFDVGAEQKAKESRAYNVWYSPILIIKLNVTDKMSLAARGEYYSDKNGVIISTGTANGFQTYGYSLNLDYAIRNNILWRIEGRALNSKDKIFTLDNKSSNQNYFITTALAISF